MDAPGTPIMTSRWPAGTAPRPGRHRRTAAGHSNPTAAGCVYALVRGAARSDGAPSTMQDRGRRRWTAWPLPQPPATRPGGVEFKAAALDVAPAAPSRRVPGTDHVVDAVVLPTGYPVGGDVFVPGCLARAVATRLPKATLSDDWSRPVGSIRAAVELPAGDPRLPRTTPDGHRWPRRAGGLLVKIAFIGATADGRLAYKAASTGARQGYSVGFRVIASRERDGLRHITDVELYTISPRLPGAPVALAAKGAPVHGIETKQTVGDWDAERRSGRDGGLPRLTMCSICGHGGGAILPGGLRAGESLTCPRCITAARGAIDGDTDGELTPGDLDAADNVTAEQVYEQAITDEQEWHLEPGGALARVPRTAWTSDSGSGRRR